MDSAICWLGMTPNGNSDRWLTIEHLLTNVICGFNMWFSWDALFCCLWPWEHKPLCIQGRQESGHCAPNSCKHHQMLQQPWPWRWATVGDLLLVCRINCTPNWNSDMWVPNRDFFLKILFFCPIWLIWLIRQKSLCSQRKNCIFREAQKSGTRVHI